MFCRNCGAKLEDDAQFCENCGTVVKKQPQKTEEQSPAAVEEPKSEEKKRSGKTTGILAAVIVAVIAVAAIFGLKGGTEKAWTDVYRESNFHTDGGFAYDDERLYFVAKFNDEDEEKSLYSTDYNGVNKKLISSDHEIGRIRVMDGKIYYNKNNSDSEEYSLGVMNADGSEAETLVDLTENCVNFSVRDGKLYYAAEEKLHAYDLGTGSDQVLMEDVNQFTFGEENIFFTASDDVVRACDLKGGSIMELCTAPGASMLVADEDRLYFKCDTGINSVPIKEKGAMTKLVEDDSVFSYVFYQDRIYYTSMFDSDELVSLGTLLAEQDNANLSAKEYAYLMVGAGPVYYIEKTGGTPVKVDASPFAVFSIYNSPQGLYQKISILSEIIEPLELTETEESAEEAAEAEVEAIS